MLTHQILVSGISPNPFASGAYYNQTLDLPTATMTFLAGGTSALTYQLRFDVYIDANSNHLFVNITSSGQPFSAVVSIDTVRTRGEAEKYSVPFVCFPGISQPDVFVDPIPAPLFAADTLVMYHRNDPDLDGSTIVQTLTQQGLAHIIPQVPDWWSGLQYGIAVDGVAGAQSSVALHRTSPETLQTVAPAFALRLRVTALSAVATPAAWLAQLAALVPTAAPRPQHEAWWQAFWARSFINVTCAADSPTPPPHMSPSRAQAPPPVDGMTLWLDASALAGTPDNTPLALWPDKSPAGNNVAQADAAQRPRYLAHGGLGGQPVVRFDGLSNFLANATAEFPAEKSIFAVMRDTGTTTICCSGVVHIDGANNGLGTVRLSGDAGDSSVPSELAAGNDDDDTAPFRVALMIDWAGSGDQGAQNIANETIVGSVIYSASNSSSYASHCLQSLQGANGVAGRGLQIGTRGNELARFFMGDLSEVLVYPRALSAAERQAVETYLLGKWSTSVHSCKRRANPCDVLGRQQVVTRYVQTIQSRTMWPIKFNGMMFQAAVPPFADYRDWGPSNWWQNTRLSYGSMLQTGDADVFETILKYYNNTLPFNTARTQAYFNHSGIFYTETKHLCGAFASEDYGCGARTQGWPVWLETNDYIKNDYGGDGGTPEVAMAVLDHFMYTNDRAVLQKYLPIATLALDFFQQHYPNRTADGKIVVWPTQALETYWCAGWDVAHNRPPENCCADDLPTVAGMAMLAEKLLQLPEEVTTPAQRAQWTAFQAMLQPLPLTADQSKYSPARIVSSGVHNSETPELYGVHPYRRTTVGRHLVSGVDLTPAINSFLSDSLAHSNEGWNQGVINAALLGQTAAAAAMVAQRAGTRAAPGYRFPGFMPHFQDYEPSANHLANYLTALNAMLLQPGDDAYNVGSMVLFPAWPCDWSVSFKLWGPMNTSVSVVYVGQSQTKGQLVQLNVDPPARRSAVIIANCAV